MGQTDDDRCQAEKSQNRKEQVAHMGGLIDLKSLDNVGIVETMRFRFGEGGLGGKGIIIGPQP